MADWLSGTVDLTETKSYQIYKLDCKNKEIADTSGTWKYNNTTSVTSTSTEYGDGVTASASSGKLTVAPLQPTSDKSVKFNWTSSVGSCTGDITFKVAKHVPAVTYDWYAGQSGVFKTSTFNVVTCIPTAVSGFILWDSTNDLPVGYTGGSGTNTLPYTINSSLYSITTTGGSGSISLNGHTYTYADFANLMMFVVGGRSSGLGDSKVSNMLMIAPNSSVWGYSNFKKDLDAHNLPFDVTFTFYIECSTDPTNKLEVKYNLYREEADIYYVAYIESTTSTTIISNDLSVIYLVPSSDKLSGTNLKNAIKWVNSSGNSITSGLKIGFDTHVCANTTGAPSLTENVTTWYKGTIQSDGSIKCVPETIPILITNKSYYNNYYLFISSIAPDSITCDYQGVPTSCYAPNIKFMENYSRLINIPTGGASPSNSLTVNLSLNGSCQTDCIVYIGTSAGGSQCTTKDVTLTFGKSCSVSYTPPSSTSVLFVTIQGLSRNVNGTTTVCEVIKMEVSGSNVQNTNSTNQSTGIAINGAITVDVVINNNGTCPTTTSNVLLLHASGGIVQNYKVPITVWIESKFGTCRSATLNDLYIYANGNTVQVKDFSSTSFSWNNEQDISNKVTGYIDWSGGGTSVTCSLSKSSFTACDKTYTNAHGTNWN